MALIGALRFSAKLPLDPYSWSSWEDSTSRFIFLARSSCFLMCIDLLLEGYFLFLVFHMDFSGIEGF